MGWYRVEDFTQWDEWQKESITHDWYDLTVTDWPEYTTDPENKEEQVRLDFLNEDYQQTYVYKRYSSPVYFRFLDDLGKWFNYDYLELIYRLHPGVSIARLGVNMPDDFGFSVALYDDGKFLREWFLPLYYSDCDYNKERVDLRPLIEQGYTKYDEIRFSVLKHPGPGSSLYFGDMYLFQDKAIHNICVGIAQMLHHQPMKFLTTTRESSTAGDDFLLLESGADIHEGTPIIIGDKESGFWEYHLTADMPVTELTEGARIKFGGGYDGTRLLYDWPAGTPIYFAPAAEFGDVTSSESPFPSYYIAVDAPEADEVTTPMGPPKKVCFVKDPDDEDHQVAFSLARDTLRVPVEIYVYAKTPEDAEDMWRYLRKKFNSQSQIMIAGEGHDYEIVTTRNPVLEELDDMPQYIMELIVYAEEGVHDLEYTKFPIVKRLTIGTGADSNVSGLLPVEVSVNFE